MTYLVNVYGKVRFCHADHLKESQVEEWMEPKTTVDSPQNSPLGLHVKTPPPRVEYRHSPLKETKYGISENRPMAISSPAKSTSSPTKSPNLTTRNSLSPPKNNPVSKPETTPLRKSARIKRAPQKLDL